ncbi:hypothetical protein MNEG_5271 [Monoraphidium neglectum]|uniref:Uncharacterized protein n=1 Tax=Monoraphidium neglectum TaxID=145388 RepID=A0A0D2L783_9CHLO|nr:hypothetical protein MNEG_5271 [Monoraphidium neglectum]KIZ02684.1 hypothetical protein MNEG_5271 [Monoraphidium neglectum]|eukprot:XP_013901703.1 hypothetical protein MNEG_5271 [Monoraphidium neglectum]
MLDLKSKTEYLAPLAAAADRSQFCALYTRPRWTMPANFLGVTHGRWMAPGGKEGNPASTIWPNNGSLKIPAAAVLKHRPVPFLIH